MANKIQVKRGAYGSLPALDSGEFGFCSDTYQVFIGTNSTNYEVLMHHLFNANTILAANTDDTPAAVTVAEERMVGRKTGGNIAALTAAEIMAILSGGAGANFSMNSHRITNGGDPVDDQDFATKIYADAIAKGLDLKESCRVGTAAALPACTPAGSGVAKTLTANAVGVLAVDGVNTVLNDRILVKDQGTGADNGIYKVTTEGTAGVTFVLTRATDFDADSEVTGGAYTFLVEGTANGSEGWILTTNDPITVDTTSLTFSQFSSATFVDNFTELTDTPANFTDDGLKIVRVNVGEAALEFVDFASMYLEASPSNGETGKAPNSDWAYDHAVATTGVHGAGANTLLHSASTIDGGAFA